MNEAPAATLYQPFSATGSHHPKVAINGLESLNTALNAAELYLTTPPPQAVPLPLVPLGYFRGGMSEARVMPGLAVISRSMPPHSAHPPKVAINGLDAVNATEEKGRYSKTYAPRIARESFCVSAINATVSKVAVNGLDAVNTTKQKGRYS